MGVIWMRRALDLTSHHTENTSTLAIDRTGGINSSWSHMSDAERGFVAILALMAGILVFSLTISCCCCIGVRDTTVWRFEQADRKLSRKWPERHAIGKSQAAICESRSLILQSWRGFDHELEARYQAHQQKSPRQFFRMHRSLLKTRMLGRLRHNHLPLRYRSHPES